MVSVNVDTNSQRQNQLRELTRNTHTKLLKTGVFGWNSSNERQHGCLAKKKDMEQLNKVVSHIKFLSASSNKEKQTAYLE